MPERNACRTWPSGHEGCPFEPHYSEEDVVEEGTVFGI